MEAIPKEYHDLAEGFNNEKACSFPRDWGDYNFSIEFKEGAKLPLCAKPYWLTQDQLEEAQKQIKELKACGMISPSKSPMAAPLFFVPKKDGTQQMCIDYHKLNDITVKDAYPLPNMEALLESARGAKVFSKFNLCAAYNMIPINQEDQWKTGFITPWGLYEFNVMHLDSLIISKK